MAAPEVWESVPVEFEVFRWVYKKSQTFTKRLHTTLRDADISLCDNAGVQEGGRAPEQGGSFLECTEVPWVLEVCKVP